MTDLDRKIRELNHRRIDFFRALKLKIVSALASLFADRGKKEDLAPILVLRLDDKLGDSVAATGFLRELKKHFSTRKLIVVAGTGNAEVYARLPFVDEVVLSRKGLINTLKLWLKLKKQNYSLILNTSHILNPRSLWLVACLGADTKVGFENESCLYFTAHVSLDFKKDHITERYAKMLRASGLSGTFDLHYEIFVDEKLRASAAAKIADLKKDGVRYVVALNSFAGGRLRNFSEDTTTQIVKHLTGRGDTAVVSLANSGDQNILREWMKHKNSKWLSFPDFCSLNENIALAAACDVVLTPDTAWVHITSALGRKLVAVFRDDSHEAEANAVIWAPFGVDCKIIKTAIKNGEINDINRVDVNQVCEAVHDMLNK